MSGSLLRVVCDTNFWISALNWRGLAYRLRERLAAGQFTNVVSGGILYEVALVLRREFGYSDEMAYQALADIVDLSVLVSPQFPLLDQVRVSRNTKDNMVIECALLGGARYIVTQDKDLLVLKEYHGITMLTFAGLLARLPRE